MTRLIGGASGGRRIGTPPGRGTRPTTDRAREGLFSSLLSLLGGVDGIALLDLFAGSGAVGLEAASRGASRVTLVERDPRALQVIRANVAAAGSATVEVVGSDVARFLVGTPAAPYDVVFVDPPYADPVAPVLESLADRGWLASGGVVCVERATRDEEPRWPAGLSPLRSRRYGDSTLWYGRAS
jgi:16S rRNA (guanine966-N2)-methyltransferase